MGIVYSARNNADGTLYIGCTRRTLEIRMGEHWSHSKRGKRTDPFAVALRKHTLWGFTWEVIKELPNDRIRAYEMRVIFLHKAAKHPLYNSTV